jgi:prepilin-type N-terminal cleavage/methylation domain-containing protein
MNHPTRPHASRPSRSRQIDGQVDRACQIGGAGRPDKAGQARQAGMTVLEIMIVLAIIGGLFYVVRSGFRNVTKADLVEDANEVTAVMRRASQLAVEHGELHRVVLDLETGGYVVEQCEGAAAIVRNEKLRNDDDDTKRAIERGKQRMANLPSDALASGDPEEATRRATALAGHHVADRTCRPATDTVTGDASGKGWLRKLRKDKGIKFKEIWVQHRDDGVTKGQVAIYFFPVGSSEKSVIELTDGNEVFSVLVYGLTGRVELRDGTLRDVNDHMLKNVMGDKDAKREDQK